MNYLIGGGLFVGGVVAGALGYHYLFGSIMGTLTLLHQKVDAVIAAITKP